MSAVKVSIIIPVYNVEAYLKRCIDSLLGQTMSEIEIICINDASTDNSLSLIQQYAEADPRVKVLSVDKCGQGLIRNMGVAVAQGEYIGFVDGDDYVDHSMFEVLYNAAVANDSDIAFCFAKCLDPGGKVVRAPYFDQEWKRCGLAGGEQTFENGSIYPLLSYISVAAWNKVYRRSFLNQYDIRFGSGIIHEDIPFYFMAMLQATRITLVREFLYRYSVYREGSTTHAVMSTYPRLIYILQETRKQIAPWLEDQVVSQQFSRFQVTQLLSFLIYAFHRHDVRRFTRLRFFCMISRELQALDPRDLKLLSLTDKMLSGLIRRRQLRLYHVKKAADVVRYHLRDYKSFRNFSVYLVKISYYHARFYSHKLKNRLKDASTISGPKGRNRK